MCTTRLAYKIVWFGAKIPEDQPSQVGTGSDYRARGFLVDAMSEAAWILGIESKYQAYPSRITLHVVRQNLNRPQFQEICFIQEKQRRS